MNNNTVSSVSKTVATSSDLIKTETEQCSIIEKAFANKSPNADKIDVELDKPLASKLWSDITQRGYNVSQKMTYDSNDTTIHNGKYHVTISKQMPNMIFSNDLVEMSSHFNEINNMFKYMDCYDPFRRLGPSLWL